MRGTRQLFSVEGKWVLRQIGNGLATKKPIGPCQCSRSRNPKAPADISFFPSPVTSLYHSEAKMRPGTRRQPGETNLRRHFFILGLSLLRSRDIRSLFVSAGERIVRAKKGNQRYSFPIRFRGGTNSPGEKKKGSQRYSFPIRFRGGTNSPSEKKKGSQRYSFPIRFRGGTNSPGEKKKGSQRYSFLIRFRGGTNSPSEKRQTVFQRVAIQD